MHCSTFDGCNRRLHYQLRRCTIWTLAFTAARTAWAATTAFLRASPKILGRLAPAALNRVASRAGVTSLSGLSAAQIAQKIGKTMMDNKLATGLVAMELYQLASEGDEDASAAIEEMRASGIELGQVITELRNDPQLDGVFEQMSFREDRPSQLSGISAMTRLKEEFDLIDLVSAQLGGFENALAFRNFVGLHNDTLVSYQQFQQLKG